MRFLQGTALGALFAAMSFAAASAAPIHVHVEPLGRRPGVSRMARSQPITSASSTTGPSTSLIRRQGAFSEHALLNFTAFTNGGSVVSLPGLGTNYTLYINFTGTWPPDSGQQLQYPSRHARSRACSTAATYTFFAAANGGFFGATAAGPTVTGLGTTVQLAHGSLVTEQGTTSLTNTAGSGLSAGANVNATFVEDFLPFFVATKPSQP